MPTTKATAKTLRAISCRVRDHLCAVGCLRPRLHGLADRPVTALYRRSTLGYRPSFSLSVQSHSMIRNLYFPDSRSFLVGSSTQEVK